MTFGGWRHEFTTKFEAGIADLTSRGARRRALIEAAADRASDPADAARLRELADQIRTGERDADQYAGPFRRARSPDGHLSRIAPRATQYAPAPRVIGRPTRGAHGCLV